MMTLSRLLAGAAVVAATALGTSLVPAQPASDGHVVVLPDQLNWESPSSVPPGVRVAVVRGPLDREGFEYTYRVHAVDGTRFPPHWHPGLEHVTVLAGTMRIGMGERFDSSRMVTLPPGAFLSLPARMPHYVQVVGDTVIQVHGIGPYGITYVNPADDPRNPRR